MKQHPISFLIFPNHFASAAFQFFLVVTSTLLALNSANAIEAFCPTGTNPRSDIKLCYSFDELASCQTGREANCWSNNGLSETNRSDARGFNLVSGEAAAGSGFLRGLGKFGTIGPGYMSFEIPNGGANAVNLRYYVRFTEGYMNYGYDHGPGFFGSGNNCGRDSTLEQSSYNYALYNAGSCGAGSFNLTPNKTNLPILKNNRWYLIEQQRIVDTSCTNINDNFGCNGVARIWIDGNLVLEYTNVNWGGVKNGFKWTHAWGPRSYFHVRHPQWEPVIDFDNFVLGVGGNQIGPAADENPRGTADNQSPYATYQGIEPFFGRHPADDCSQPSGYLGTNFGQQWRNGGVLSSSVARNSFTDQCHNPPQQDQSLKIRLSNSSSGGGLSWDRDIAENKNFTFDQQVIYGWMYLPSGNDLSNTPLLSGFRSYQCANNTCDESSWGRFLALTVNNGKFALAQRFRPSNSTTQVVATSSKSVIENSWVEFELILWKNNKASLMINHEKVFDKIDLPIPVPLLFTGGGGDNSGSLVVGVLDFEGTSPFTIYYDDVSVGTASFWSCDGWGDSSCPFGADEVDPSPPSKPTGFRALN